MQIAEFSKIFKIKNFSGKDATLYTAVYDKSNTLLSIKLDTIECGDDYEEVKAVADSTGVVNDAKIKLFVFGGDDEITPFIPAIEVAKAE